MLLPEENIFLKNLSNHGFCVMGLLIVDVTIVAVLLTTTFRSFVARLLKVMVTTGRVVRKTLVFGDWCV